MPRQKIISGMVKYRILFLILFLHILFSGCSQSVNIDAEELNFNRDVFITTPPPHFIPENSTGTIYLTFDDGPLYGSENINTIIESEKIRVNVFVVGRHAKSNKKLMDFYNRYLENPYIEVGNHSYSHASGNYRKFYSNTPLTIEDFEKCQSELKIPTKLARLPGRNHWRLNNLSKNDISSGINTSDSLHKIGFKVYGWDIEWNKNPKTGGPKETVEYMFNLIEKKLSDGNTLMPGHIILLTHDEMFSKSGANELQLLIEKLKAANKFAFDYLSNYPG